MSSGNNEKRWGDTTSKQGEVSRVFMGSVDYRNTSCAEIEVRLFDKSNHPTKSRERREDRSRSPVFRQQPPMGGPTGTRHGAALPPSSYYEFPPPPPVEEPPIGNDAEIIVINKDQWGYAEMIEKRIRRECAIDYTDMLFLHTPSSLNITLNDLYERRTLYAIVISPINETHQSLTLHILHNQTEHRNMPLNDAIELIRRDFQTFLTRKGIQPPVPLINRNNDQSSQFAPYAPPPLPPPPQPPVPSSVYGRGYGNNGSTSTIPPLPVRPPPERVNLPEDIAFLLRTVLQENGPQFLSLLQIDSIIDYFMNEKRRLTGASQGQGSFHQGTTGQTQGGQSQGQSSSQVNDLEQQKAKLLENPHVKAALSSLLQIGAISNLNVGPELQDQKPNLSSASAPRRHPLLGTDVGPSGMNMSQGQGTRGTIGGMVQYPLPNRY